MESGIAKSFYERTDNRLSRIRNGIIIFAQDRDSASHLDMPVRELAALSDDAVSFGLPKVGSLAADCIRSIEQMRTNGMADAEAGPRNVLDLVAEIEAALFQEQIIIDDVFAQISDSIDESFENLDLHNKKDANLEGSEPQIGFEIDEETAEIFRSEATELLDTITSNLEVLSERSDDEQALWSLRRCIHTFKGAAGIVGLHAASALAHRIEDLLGSNAIEQSKIEGDAVELIKIATECLNAMAACPSDEPAELRSIYSKFDRLLGKGVGEEPHPNQIRQATQVKEPEPTVNGAATKRQPTPIVRVSLDRLDELQKIILKLTLNRTSLATSFENVVSRIGVVTDDHDPFSNIGSLMEDQIRMTNELRFKLAQLRMVRFGMLSTRLGRAVHVTCHEENKKVEIVIENEDIELDTQVIDSLVEPLLHLLRNAVVHGIESPETRRMIGKPEKGKISIRVDQTDKDINVTVIDDGRGISVGKLKEKALSSGSLSQQLADSMTDEEAYDLMFLRGVTTAETLNLNAGRGVGMSIVRESVETSNGTISISSEPQKGTSFTIRLPLIAAATAEPLPTVVPRAEVRKVEMPKFEVPKADVPKAEVPKFEVQKVEVSRADVPETISITPPLPSDEISVLIVDDSALMRQTITKVVEKAGWKAVTAPDGRNALDRLKDAVIRPNIIITDLEMPGLDGFELLEALKNDPQLSDIPVIMITTRSDRMHREKARRLGAAKFLAKPFEGVELKAIIDHLCMVPA